MLRRAGVSYAIARPCGIFGDTAKQSILMNNAAWVLRRSPLFLLAGGTPDYIRMTLDTGVKGVQNCKQMQTE